MRIPVIHAMNQRIFKGNAAFCFLRVIPARLQKSIHIVQLCHRHGLRTDFVIRRMQGNRQCNLKIFLRQRINFFHQAAGRKRNMSLSHILPIRVVNQTQKFQNIVIIIQRLAAAHQYRTVYPLAAVLLNRINLGKHFPCRQSAFHAVQCGCAEFAAHPTADLRRNADCIAMLIFHQYTFDNRAIRKRKKIFSRAVNLRNQPPHDFHTVDCCRFAKLFPQAFGKIRHFGKAVHLLCVQPIEKLLRTKFRLTQFLQKLLQFGYVHGFDINLFHISILSS